MSENTNENTIKGMREVTVELSAPKEYPAWKLSVKCEEPTTFEGWGEYLGKDVAAQALSRFLKIRRQDLGRRSKVGGKNTAPMKDADIIEAVKAYRFDKVRVVAQKRPPTPEEAKTAIVTQVKSKDEMLRLIAELSAAAETM